MGGLFCCPYINDDKLPDMYFKSANTQKKVILILGGPGTGKSTVAKSISVKYDMDDISKENNEIDNQGHRQCHKIRDEITNSKKSTILIEKYPKTMDDLKDWKNVIAEHCSVIGCIYLHCSNELIKYRFINKTSLVQSQTDINILLSDSSNGISCLDYILEFVPAVQVSNDGSIEKLIFEVSKELEKPEGILESNKIHF